MSPTSNPALAACRASSSKAPSGSVGRRGLLGNRMIGAEFIVPSLLEDAMVVTGGVAGCLFGAWSGRDNETRLSLSADDEAFAAAGSDAVGRLRGAPRALVRPLQVSTSAAV